MTWAEMGRRHERTVAALKLEAEKLELIAVR
jgi:hypothetical protein